MGLKKRVKSLEKLLGVFYDDCLNKHYGSIKKGDFQQLYSMIYQLADKIGHEFEWRQEGYTLKKKKPKKEKK